jgi:hypothetical protein
LLGAILFLIAIMPLGKEEWPNPILALGLAYLMTKDYPVSVPGQLVSWLRRQQRQSALDPLARLRH